MTEHEEPKGSEAQRKAAIGCLALIGLSFAGTAFVAFPAAGFFLAGLVAAAVVRRARAWIADRRRDAPEDGGPETEPVDIVAVLQGLGEGGQNVLLTALRDAADLPDTKTVRALLDEAGIRIRPGVRVGEKNDRGVHHDDIPRPSPALSAPSEACVCSGHGANANTNNTAEKGPGEGMRAVRTDTGVTYYDPAETQQRHHAISR